MEIINVMIKDGQRTVNWDFPDNTNIAYVLGRFKFKPVPGSIKACGVDVPNPSLVQLKDCVMEMNPSGTHDGVKKRVRITLTSAKTETKQSKIVNFSAFKELEDSGDVC